MADMFYKLEEVIKKLGKSEAELKELVKEGSLREFRDGASLLYKVDEVEALLKGIGVDEEAVIELTPGGTAEVELKPDETQAPPEEAAVLGETTEGEGGGSESISVLGASDSEFQLTDDTMGKTQEAKPGADELGKIEEDVSLDSFGSGSGLLDLSLQADDTSLGADILDDIYPAEGEKVAAGGEMMEAAAEADQIMAETTGTASIEEAAEEISEVIEEAVPAQPAYAEGRADAVSNAFGFVLLVPLLALVYTTIVAVSGLKGVAPAILTGVAKVPNLIWYIGIGGMVVAGAMIGIAAMLSGKGGKKQKKRAQPSPAS